MACVFSPVLFAARTDERALYRNSTSSCIGQSGRRIFVSSFTGQRVCALKPKCSSRPSNAVQVKAEAGEKVTIDNATVLVVGGGGIGMEVTRKLAKAGSWVTVFQRGEKFRKEIEELGAMLAIGNVLDPSTLAKPFKTNTFDAVVCTVGGGTADTNVDKDGTINVINAAKAANVARFIMVSSVGAGDSEKAIDAKTLETLREVLKAKTAAEDVLKSSGLQYTILRPGGLTNDPASGSGILTHSTNVVGLISRTEVASLISQVLFDERTYSKTLTAIDSQKLFPPTTSLEGIEVLALA